MFLHSLQALTDSHCREIGDYDALVIVQQAGFEEGELLLYERLQMTPMLLERYAKDGSEKSRRQMLAMCKTEPEVLADVLGHLVSIASEKTKNVRTYIFSVLRMLSLMLMIPLFARHRRMRMESLTMSPKTTS